MTGQVSLWPNFEEKFLKDLKGLRDRVGPWDAVLFTGDITQKGTEAEFKKVDELFLKLWASFKEWGFTPELLAIPGNHDLARPQDETEPALVTLLKSWDVPEVQKPFWENPDSHQRRVVTNAFQAFTNWWDNTPIPKPAAFNKGLLPGDCSATFQGDGFSVGVVGLNSAYLQLAEGNFERKLHLDVRQLQAVCNGHAPDWINGHDACLLLTHHPVHWLLQNAEKHFAEEIHAPPERFALHLFGHMHESNLTSIAHGGGGTRLTLQGCSLFGLETWGENQMKREHGYSLCELKSVDGELRLRIWPRRAIDKPSGRELERDLKSFTLEEGDGGTKPIVVKQLKTIVPASTGSPAVLFATPAERYDPRNPPFYVPYHQKGDQVIGRDEALANVRQQLINGKHTTIGQTAVFEGIGGLGKTQLAVEYAYRYRSEYPNGIIWLTSGNNEHAEVAATYPGVSGAICSGAWRKAEEAQVSVE